MDLALSETQQLVRDSVRDYLAREVPFDRIREVERSGSYDVELWRSLQQLGWLGLPFPEAIRGSGGSIADLAVLIEELAKRAAIIPILETMVAALTIQRFGDNAARETVAAVLAGGAIVVPAVLEANDRFDDVRMAIDGGRLSGEKYFVDYGADATHHLVAALRDGEIALYLVARDDPGVKVEPLHTIGRAPQARVTYDGATATPVCGGDGYRYLVRLGRALAAVQCLGCAQQALDMTVDYVSRRVQFGQPIGSFQAVQHHCANMATMVESARFLAYEAVWAVDHDLASDEQVALAKAWASRSVAEVTMQAHQLHGGIGIVEEYDLYFFSLRGKERALAWGSAEECLAIVAGSVDQREDWLPMWPSAST
ncbi:MAG: acyl-CoA dehydrogenase family protein [Dehalococcoidia bacterium]